MNTNYSLYAIPAFYALAFVPAFTGTNLIIKARNGIHYNVSPRSQEHLDAVQKTVPKETFERFERSKAAHNNSLEALPAFAAAIICGTMAQLSPRTLNIASASFLALRAAYIVAYISITNNKLSYIRSGLWFASVGLCMGVMVAAANKIAV